MNPSKSLFNSIRRLHQKIRVAVVETCEQAAAQATIEDLSRIVQDDDEGDTIYAIDRVSEKLLIDFFEKEVATIGPIVLIAEGLSKGQIILPREATESEAQWRIIVDPIDGTRGLMYQKRSAWILTGVAPNRGAATTLQDIEFAIQTEIPLVKQHLSDMVWAFRGQGSQAERYNRLTGEPQPLHLYPSEAKTIAHGFAMLARFFPGARAELGAIDDEIAEGALGPTRFGKARCSEDQYVCTGGQLYELMAGHDRFIADIRPLMAPLLAQRGLEMSMCCHPYDVCTELIARELGVIITNEYGQPLNARLTLEDNVTWVGYANPTIRQQIEPLLQKALLTRQLIQTDNS